MKILLKFSLTNLPKTGGANQESSAAAREAGTATECWGFWKQQQKKEREKNRIKIRNWRNKKKKTNSIASIVKLSKLRLFWVLIIVLNFVSFLVCHFSWPLLSFPTHKPDFWKKKLRVISRTKNSKKWAYKNSLSNFKRWYSKIYKS